eukprot:1153532-Pelagomonas_calceolata.AAC.4
MLGIEEWTRVRVRAQAARAEQAEAARSSMHAQLEKQSEEAEALRVEVRELHQALQAMGYEGKALHAELERLQDRGAGKVARQANGYNLGHHWEQGRGCELRRSLTSGIVRIAGCRLPAPPQAWRTPDVAFVSPFMTACLVAPYPSAFPTGCMQQRQLGQGMLLWLLSCVQGMMQPSTRRGVGDNARHIHQHLGFVARKLLWGFLLLASSTWKLTSGVPAVLPPDPTPSKLPNALTNKDIPQAHPAAELRGSCEARVGACSGEHTQLECPCHQMMLPSAHGVLGAPHTQIPAPLACHTHLDGCTCNSEASASFGACHFTTSAASACGGLDVGKRMPSLLYPSRTLAESKC